jgi:hypothetical protein
MIPRYVLLLAALLSVLAGTALLALLQGPEGVGSSPPPAARSAAATQSGHSTLPVGAQGPISAVVGADLPAYRVSAAGGAFEARSPAQRLSARFQRSGVELASGTVKLQLSLSAIGDGGSLKAVGHVTPSARANRVSYAHGALSEWYVNGPLGVEQGFTIEHAPARGAGPLTLAMALSGNARASLARGAQSVTLTHGATSLRYGGLTATDASGRALHSWLAVAGGRVLLRVDASGARYPLTIDPLIQQGSKLTGAGEEGEGQFGISVALSADGDTALIGGTRDDNLRGAVWVFTRSASGWTQQGAKLTDSHEVGGGGPEECIEEAGEEPGECSFGRSLALSADGNTALIGDPSDATRDGIAWVFTRSNGVWTQPGTPLTGPEETGEGRFGKSVALSADGNTALIGDPSAELGHGTAWVFARSGSSWAAQGQALPAGERNERVHFGRSVALSADGNTALIGDPAASGYAGAAWVLTRSGATWTQEGEELTGGSEEPEAAHFGYSVALSGDGETALIGGPFEGKGVGAAWVFTHSGSSFAQQGQKLTGPQTSGEPHFAYSVTLSGDGDLALIGAPRENNGHGAVLMFTRAGVEWTALHEQLAGSEAVGPDWSGASVALSADAGVALIGAPREEGKVGAAWGFVDEPAPTVPPTVTNLAPRSGPAQGGTSVTITGTNFTGATEVHFGSVPATRFEVNSALEIEAESPAEPEGTKVDVTVTTPAGTSAVSSADSFRFASTKSIAGGPNEPPSDPGTGGATGGSTAAGGVLGFTSSASGACQVSLKRKHLAVTAFTTAALRLLRTGTGACKGTVTLRYRVKGKGKHFELKTIGAAGFSISPGKSEVVKIKLNKAGRALFRKDRGKLNASLAIVRATPVPVLGRTASVRLSRKKTPRSRAVEK